MEAWQIIGVTAAMLLAVIAGNWAITSHYFNRVDKKLEIHDQKFEAMNQRIFELALALRPHIRQAQQEPVNAG